MLEFHDNGQYIICKNGDFIFYIFYICYLEAKRWTLKEKCYMYLILGFSVQIACIIEQELVRGKWL